MTVPEYVTESRRAQGLSDRVIDPSVLASVAVLLSSEGRNAA